MCLESPVPFYFFVWSLLFLWECCTLFHWQSASYSRQIQSMSSGNVAANVGLDVTERNMTSMRWVMAKIWFLELEIYEDDEHVGVKVGQICKSVSNDGWILLEIWKLCMLPYLRLDLYHASHTGYVVNSFCVLHHPLDVCLSDVIGYIDVKPQNYVLTNQCNLNQPSERNFYSCISFNSIYKVLCRSTSV